MQVAFFCEILKTHFFQKKNEVAGFRTRLGTAAINIHQILAEYFRTWIVGWWSDCLTSTLATSNINRQRRRWKQREEHNNELVPKVLGLFCFSNCEAIKNVSGVFLRDKKKVWINTPRIRLMWVKKSPCVNTNYSRSASICEAIKV